jgi:hypothetical protein
LGGFDAIGEPGQPVVHGSAETLESGRHGVELGPGASGVGSIRGALCGGALLEMFEALHGSVELGDGLVEGRHRLAEVGDAGPKGLERGGLLIRGIPVLVAALPDPHTANLAPARQFGLRSSAGPAAAYPVALPGVRGMRGSGG